MSGYEVLRASGGPDGRTGLRPVGPDELDADRLRRLADIADRAVSAGRALADAAEAFGRELSGLSAGRTDGTGREDAAQESRTDGHPAVRWCGSPVSYVHAGHDWTDPSGGRVSRCPGQTPGEVQRAAEGGTPRPVDEVA